MADNFRRVGRLLAVAAIAALAGPHDARAASLETLEPRPGVSERFILMPAEGPALASVVLLTGGSGRLGLTPENIDRPFGNFLVRSRALFAARGLQVAVLDSPSDRGELGAFRLSAEHAADLAAVIRFLRAKVPVPVWLVGTSMGTISAAAAASRLADAPPGERPDGIVLTSTVTIQSRGDISVYSAALDRIHVPVLLVHHRADGCKVSPFGNVAGLARAFPASAKVETMAFEGGDTPRSDPCQPFAQHGYLGIESSVVDAIAHWIEAAH